ncbi:TetR/AcrR family transcriptional regulator [Martelella soudanensis]|uniref:TetR/AcrR family transcriptional regulator n=1 Tax=unclassified Martelella TaxID=2629616 RepID=UPI0015DDB405|nr:MULTISPECIES: TetR/AcrR family transcriptional regulator [unclassified Martelella]
MDHPLDQRLQARVRLRQLPDHQRAAWLDVAEEEFRALGFEGASMNRILTRAALSKGQAYYYFADKSELYRAVIERAIAELADLINARPVQPESIADYWEQSAALFGHVTATLKQNDRLAELGRGVYQEAAAQAAIADLLEAFHAQFERLIEAGQQIGAVRSDLPLALLTDMAFAAAREADRWFALNAQKHDSQSLRVLNRRVFSMFAAMLAPGECGAASANVSESPED